MSGTKIFIAVLVLIVLLFAGSSIFGLARGGGKPGMGDLSPGWIGGLRARLAPEKNLGPADVSRASPERCWPQPDTFAIDPNGACTVELRGTQFLSLKLVLQLVQGQELTVAVAQEIDPDRRATTTQTLRPQPGAPPAPSPAPGGPTPRPRSDQTRGPSILKSGATVALSCRGLVPCRAKLIAPPGAGP